VPLGGAAARPRIAVRVGAVHSPLRARACTPPCCGGHAPRAWSRRLTPHAARRTSHASRLTPCGRLTPHAVAGCSTPGPTRCRVGGTPTTSSTVRPPRQSAPPQNCDCRGRYGYLQEMTQSDTRPRPTTLPHLETGTARRRAWRSTRPLVCVDGARGGEPGSYFDHE
jgi:hypothetical protein